MTNIIHKIDSKDISVIIQGAITKETDACLRSIRECLPLAEIILSTWEKSIKKLYRKSSTWRYFDC